MLSTTNSRVEENQWTVAVSENLEEFLEYCRAVDSKRNDLVNGYREWKTCMENTIHSITESRDAMESYNKRSNYISLGGNIGMLTGGVMSILGAVAAIPTGGASLILTGAAISVSGTTVSAVSNYKKKASSNILCETVVSNLDAAVERNRILGEEFQGYFRTLDAFNNYFQTIRGNHVAFSLFYEAATEEGFQFINDPSLNAWSREQIRLALLQTHDPINLNPGMWPIDIVQYLYNGASTVASSIRTLIDYVRVLLDRDPNLRRILLGRLREFLIETLGNIRGPALRNALRTVQNGALAVGGLVSPIVSITTLSLNISNLLAEMSTAIRVAVVAFNALCIVLGLVSTMKTLINMEHGSKSDQSRQLRRTIDHLKNIKEKIDDEMGNMFGPT